MEKNLLKAMFIPAALFAAAVLFFTVRRSMADRAVEAEWQLPLPTAPALAATSHLEIMPLYEEAGAGPDLISGHGVSYLIRTDSSTILMDIGHNPNESEVAPFMQNMQALGIDWNEIGRIVLTHPHPDHMGGITAWKEKKVLFGELPGGLGGRIIFVPTDMAFPGAVHVTIPTLPGSDVATTGAISYAETWPMLLYNARSAEQALVVHVAGHGLVLIAGCGHPGLEKLVERAETLYGMPVTGVVGGLHYEGLAANEVYPHIQFLQTRRPGLVALSPHDSSPEALAAFEAAFPEIYHTLTVGEVVQFP